MSDNDKIRIYSYDKVWTVEKKIYSIYNLKLPVPISPEQMLYFAGTVAIMFIPALKFLPAVIRFIVIPYFISNFLVKKKLDGKNPIRYFLGYIQYLITERGTYLEKFKINPIRKEEKITLNWICSQGYYLETQNVVHSVVDPVEDIQSAISKKIKRLPVKSKEEKVPKKRGKKPEVNEEMTVKKRKQPTKEIKKSKNIEKIKVEEAKNKTIAIHWLRGIEKVQEDFVLEFTDFLTKDNKKYSFTDEGEKDLDYKISSQEFDSEKIIEADTRIMMCCLDKEYLKTLAKFIKEQKKIKDWCFVFMNLDKGEVKQTVDLMEDYKTFCISNDLQTAEKEKIFRKILK